MDTIALRFSDNFAPREGTIKAHQDMIDLYGFVWYGKLGFRVSDKVAKDILKNKQPRILLIRSGKTDRYWAEIEKIQHEVPNKENIPSYYRDEAGRFNTWFKIISITKVPENVLSKCYVKSSNNPLSEASRKSMSPYFVIRVEE